jgi:hypothetical protein
MILQTIYPHFYSQTWDHQGSPQLALKVIDMLNQIYHIKILMMNKHVIKIVIIVI